VVAPVMALMGLTVMLPHSLNQMSFWICGDTVRFKSRRVQQLGQRLHPRGLWRRMAPP
jgi:hypothetical protein